MKKLTIIHYIIPYLLLLMAIILISSSCNMKSGNTVSIHVPYIIYDSLSGKSHKIVYGAGRSQVLKVNKFKLGDTILARHQLLIVTNTRINRKLDYFEQGYSKNTSMNSLKKIFLSNCRVVDIQDTAFKKLSDKSYNSFFPSDK